MTSVSSVRGGGNAGVVTMDIDSERAPDSRQRNRRDQGANLPGGQRLRRSVPGQPERADPPIGCDPPGRQHLRSRAAQQCALVAHLLGPREPADAGSGTRGGAQRATVAGTGRDPGSQRPGPHRRRGPESRAQVLGARVRGIGDRQSGTARDPARRPLRRRRRQREGVQRPWRRPVGAREPGDDVQPDDGDARLAPAGA